MVVFAKVVRRNSVSQCVIYDVLVIAMSGRAIRIDGCTNNVEFFALNNDENSPL